MPATEPPHAGRPAVPLCAGAIVVAAGQGLRMGAACRKQYLELGGRPILAMTLQVLAESGCFGPLLAVVPPEELDFCRERILRPAGLERRVALAAGGAERQDSVYRGLLALPPVAVVAVHDGVRPLVGAAEIRACVAAAAQAGGAILALPVVETLKLVDDAGAIRRTLPRSRIYAAQTPQAFRTEILRAAHERARREGWRATDDAMLVERNGGRVTVLPGSRRNIKITTPEDLRLAQALLAAGWPGGGG